jgi:hypothetical protein
MSVVNSYHLLAPVRRTPLPVSLKAQLAYGADRHRQDCYGSSPTTSHVTLIVHHATRSSKRCRFMFAIPTSMVDPVRSVFELLWTDAQQQVSFLLTQHPGAGNVIREEAAAFGSRFSILANQGGASVATLASSSKGASHNTVALQAASFRTWHGSDIVRSSFCLCEQQTSTHFSRRGIVTISSSRVPIQESLSTVLRADTY